MQESFDWVKPSPFWAKNGDDLEQGSFFRPALLEYASDDFVEEFLADTGASTADLLEERVLSAGNGSVAKLYQPAHGRFYLVCATLSCRQPGLPDRAIRLAEGESVFYVLRRLQGSVEYAWIVNGDTPAWKPIDPESQRRLVDHEERQPMFRAAAGNERGLLYAYVPATSRSATGGGLTDIPEGELGEDPPTDLRLFELEGRFLSPLESGVIDDANASSANEARRLSVYLLLDLWEYFERYLPNLAARLDNDGSVTLTAAEQTLLTFLSTEAALSGLPRLATMLTSVAGKRAELDNLGDEDLTAPFNTNFFNLSGRTADDTLWTTRVQAALAAVDSQQNRQPPQVVLPRIQPGADEQYIIRCVYERPQCEPVQRWVSHPTTPFELAALYDPDAPARQINIALPTDMSLSALRKFQKGANFVMSQAVRNKVSQVTGIDLGSGPADPGGISLSYICSFSIPIITICAFILLLILVIVLNLVFWWLPFFKICLPIPKSGD